MAPCSVMRKWVGATSMMRCRVLRAVADVRGARARRTLRPSASTSLRVQFHRRFLELVRVQQRPHGEAAIDCLVDGVLLLAARRLQDEVDDLRAIARMADAQAQPPEILAEVRDDVLQSVVAGRAAAALQLDTARRQVELVVHDQDLVRQDLVEPRQRANCAAARVHEGRRFEQPALVVATTDAADDPVEARFHAQLHALGARESVDEPEARVVSRPLVFTPRIAEAHHQSHRIPIP